MVSPTAATASSPRPTRERPPPKGAPDSQASLYKVLQVSPTATGDEVKRAYYRLALECHPDRSAGDKDEAKEAFQRIGRAYEVLSDPARRAAYDECGMCDSLDSPSPADWGTYFRDLFHSVTFADLDAFKRIYVGSVEEYEDVLVAYKKHNGDIAEISDAIFFGDCDSEARYLKIIQRAIEKGILPPCEKIQQVASDDRAFLAMQRKRQKRAQSEAVQAAALAKELKIGTGGEEGSSSTSDLYALIRNRQQGRYDALITNLESKYGQAGKKKKTALGSPGERAKSKRGKGGSS